MADLIAGQAAELLVSLPLEPWQRTPGTLRVRLRAPSGRSSLYTRTLMLRPGHYVARPILREPGNWDYQFEVVQRDGQVRVLGVGRVVVEATVFEA